MEMPELPFEGWLGSRPAQVVPWLPCRPCAKCGDLHPLSEFAILRALVQHLECEQWTWGDEENCISCGGSLARL